MPVGHFLEVTALSLRYQRRKRDHASLLRHAARTVPAYAGYDGARLTDFPIATKQQIRANPERYVSSDFDMRRLVVRTTTGTTGAPLQVHLDKVSLYGTAYEWATSVMRAFARAPDEWPKPGSVGVLTIGVDHDDHRPVRRTHFPSLSFSHGYAVSLRNEDPANAAALATILQAGPAVISAMPTGLMELAAHIERNVPAWSKPRVLVASGENMLPNQRRALEAFFEAPVFDCYASMELGFAAVQCSLHDYRHAEPGVTFEVRTDANLITDCGTGELIGTGLNNLAMPFVRYATGDVVTLDRIDACACGKAGQIIRSMDGRANAMFVHAGNSVNPRAVVGPLAELPLENYQLVQTGADAIRLQVVPSRSATDQEQLAARAAEALRSRLPFRDVAVELVTEIPRDGVKARQFVPLAEPMS